MPYSHSPSCPHCSTRMRLATVTTKSSFEVQAYECRRCGFSATRTEPLDPMQKAEGWIKGELRPPQ